MGTKSCVVAFFVAFRIPKGAAVGLQIHYISTGKPEKCRISVGFKFAHEKVQKQLRYVLLVDHRFAIPPGAPAHPVTASKTLDQDAIGVGMFCHMHVRGKDMTFRSHRPDGKSETLLLIPNYNFDWQMPYRWEPGKVRLPKGTWSILVDKSMFRMWILYEGCPFKGYTITIGASAKETPVAKFVMGGKNPNPAWWPPPDVKIQGKAPVPYGDPQNPLGKWWISLEHDIHHGIGIHGTNDPGSIGSKASNGCVRMLNEEVVEVAALAFKGMVVTVVE